MNEIKAFQVRLPKKIWSFLKKQSVDQEKSMNVIISNCLEKYEKSYENKLTSSDTMIL